MRFARKTFSGRSTRCVEGPGPTVSLRVRFGFVHTPSESRRRRQRTVSHPAQSAGPRMPVSFHRHRCPNVRTACLPSQILACEKAAQLSVLIKIFRQASRSGGRASERACVCVCASGRRRRAATSCSNRRCGVPRTDPVEAWRNGLEGKNREWLDGRAIPGRPRVKCIMHRSRYGWRCQASPTPLPPRISLLLFLPSSIGTLPQAPYFIRPIFRPSLSLLYVGPTDDRRKDDATVDDDSLTGSVVVCSPCPVERTPAISLTLNPPRTPSPGLCYSR